MPGKLIIIEGTDCSGKETQSKKVVERLTLEGYPVFHYSFPCYDSPTGKIIGGPYLGKEKICSSWFKEGPNNVNPLVSSCFYAADRLYNIDIVNKHLENGDIVIIDRYVESNMAHQGGKLKSKEERYQLFKKIETLEFDILDLPRPDAVIFLYMPYEYANILKKERLKKEGLDEIEKNEFHLKAAEATYLEMCELYNFKKISCVKDDAIRTIEDINNDVYKTIKKIIG